MKPRSLVHEGDGWAVWRITTDRPEEIREALETRGIVEVYKGDQNQAWDAVLANHCLLRAVGPSAEVRLFVQDEKLGTPDSLLARLWRSRSAGTGETSSAAGDAPHRFALTEDYYRGRKGAVWEHQDVSYGLFYTEPVAPEQFASAAVHLHRAAELWEQWAPSVLANDELLGVLSDLGVSLRSERSDGCTRLGPPANAADLASCFEEQPQSLFYYALTKSTGLYGVVPTSNDDVTISSIPADDPEVLSLGKQLLVKVAAAGAMRAAGTRAARRAIKQRARELAKWSEKFLNSRTELGAPASIADLQAALGRHLTAETFPEDRISLSRTSEFMSVEPGALERLSEPDDTLFYLLDVALRHPSEFTEAYNEALNRVGFGLQRVRHDPGRCVYQPPFFVEFAPGGAGTPTYRFGIRVEGDGLILANQSFGSIEIFAHGRIDSARRLCEALCLSRDVQFPMAVVGKAAVFAAELRRWPRALGLPRQGSKYAPMVDFLMAGLEQRGVVAQQGGLLLRIGLNALDRLEALGGVRLRLPRFVEDVLGPELSAGELAARWRGAAGEAAALLEILGEAEFGQHVHLARILALNGSGTPLERAVEASPRLRKVVEQLAPDAERRSRLAGLGRDVSPRVCRYIDGSIAERDRLLARRRELREATLASVEQERSRLEFELLLIYAAYVRRLWQRAESLPYLNDRPYSLALYLLFGPEFFRVLCRNVEFDLEYSDALPLEPVDAPPAASSRTLN